MCIVKQKGSRCGGGSRGTKGLSCKSSFVDTSAFFADIFSHCLMYIVNIVDIADTSAFFADIFSHCLMYIVDIVDTSAFFADIFSHCLMHIVDIVDLQSLYIVLQHTFNQAKQTNCTISKILSLLC